MDPLVEMKPESWGQIRDLFQQNLPNGITGLCLLDLQISYPALREYFKFNLYCPFGEIKNGFVAIITKGQCYQVSIHFVDSLDPIEKALAKTLVIDWNQNIMMPCVGPEITQCMERLQKELSINISYEKEAMAIEFFLPGNIPRLEIRSSPDNTYVSSCKPEDLKLLDDTWPYKGEDSFFFFQSLMKCGLTWVLYQDQEPLAWTTVSEAGFLTHLYCVEGHRKKGYAEHVLRVALNELLGRGINIVACTLPGNFSSQNLLEKVGFKRICETHWLFCSKS